MANALSFLADPEYYKSAANVATGYGNQLADLLKEGKNRITSGRAILTGEPIAESLRNQYFSNDQNALASLAMDWANPVPVSGLVGGIISKGGKAVDALKYSDDVARSIPNKTEFEIAHEVAQRNAALPVEQGGLGLPANNTAMDRAKAMGFDTPAYHGTNADIQAFDNSMAGENVQYMKGVFTADNPDLAGNYGDTIYPLLQNKGVTVRDKVAAKRLGLPAPAVDTIYDKNAGILVTENPSNIRSRFAAFDPFQRNSANILAGGAAGGIGINALHDLMNQEEYQ